MSCKPALLTALLALVALLLLPAGAAAHAALERSVPAAGAVVPESPAEIRLWFTEPLEATYTRAELLDATGAVVPSVSVGIASEDDYQLVLLPPANLPDGGYTVAWRTLSAADGHTLQGYFAFRVGQGSLGAPLPSATVGSSQSDPWRALSRGLALVGLAALLAVAPLALWLFAPLAARFPDLSSALDRGLRRYAIIAVVAALFGSLAALVAQANAVVPERGIVPAMAQTMAETRYGQLWLVRLALQLAIAGLCVWALWKNTELRRPLLFMASAVSLLAPLPFSLLSHASAQVAGRAAAVTSDALHLLAASVWAGGLFMLALVLLPSLRAVPDDRRRAILAAAIPRFSAVGLAAWLVLLLSGLYASWLQVGSVDALGETDYGRTLLLKGSLLLPVLALAAYHFILGWRGTANAEPARVRRTFVAEGLLVVAVLLVAGWLIGLEPARAVLASRPPSALSLPLQFATDDGNRSGTLTVSPGTPGENTFTLTVEGEPLDPKSEAVLRFTLPSQDIGAQELLLSGAGQNQYTAAGSELALPGDWQIRAIVRQIGSFSWSADLIATIGSTPPASPMVNPPPLFGPAGAGAMLLLAASLGTVAFGIAMRDVARRRRIALSAAGVVLSAAGAIVLWSTRLATPEEVIASKPSVATPVAAAASSATPVADHEDGHTHASRPAAETPAAGAGTPVTAGGLSATLLLQPGDDGRNDIRLELRDAANAPIAGARVTILSEMSGMPGRDETSAAEIASGSYVAESVPMDMAGEWRLTVRVSPKGASTQIMRFVVDVP